MLGTMITSEVGCVRYSGRDPAVIRRLAESGEGALSDTPPPADIVPTKRDHVGLQASAQLTPRALADAFVAHLQTRPMPERFKTRIVQSSVDRCELAVAWFEDKFHPLTFQRSAVPEYPWLIIGLESLVYDWLSDGSLGQAAFFNARDWHAARSDGSTVAW